ncbi:group II truncated hemoglobin [Lentisphaera profundi]|uniref:Group II truncated hemoglobin n=1 Tax=Lentisphaera profundi TaxID=1658616 RepID=A0ABY7VQD4_9BACT|nr:group II truncated hemoglobin [Lentisphaera profundi]WDE95929.1 group II truncated hemoglobin [Lentisphaera profundi]
MEIQDSKYGQEDATYKAVGEADGLMKLVSEFYRQMSHLEEAKVIRAMHPNDLTESEDKLYCFLSAWMGGPRLYAEKYGTIAIPRAHAHLDIDVNEMQAWLLCMNEALQKLNYPQDFQEYLMTQLKVPAERIRLVCMKSKEN